jgi:hypothetical protein
MVQPLLINFKVGSLAKITAATEQAKIKDGAQLPRTAGRFLATMRDRDMRAKGFIEGEPRGLEIKRRQG